MGERERPHIAQAGLEPLNLLLSPLQCWCYRSEQAGVITFSRASSERDCIQHFLTGLCARTLCADAGQACHTHSSLALDVQDLPEERVAPLCTRQLPHQPNVASSVSLPTAPLIFLLSSHNCLAALHPNSSSCGHSAGVSSPQGQEPGLSGLGVSMLARLTGALHSHGERATL